MPPSAVVVGGGVTGTGVARDLAARGVDVTLVERDALAAGATGHMHGLLHSGARYAVADPASARECARENRVLREIAPHCVADAGGLFVQRPEDDAAYFDRKLAACRDCGIPAEPLSGVAVRDREPALADVVERAIRVPDATVDPFRLCVATALAARRRDARIEVRAEVTGVLRDGDRVTGVEVRHRGEGAGGSGSTERIQADHVVNAAGAWAGEVAALAGVEVDLHHSKGAMAVLDWGGLDTVVNWCRPKGEADIVVPRGDAAVLGTTDEPVEDPDDYVTGERAGERLVAELSALVPALRGREPRHVFWGVRPLYDPGASGADPTAVTRSFSLLDHADRDGLAGLTSVVGGKLTTHRLMAREASERVCDALGVTADCRTAEEPLPGAGDPGTLREALASFGVEVTPGWRST